jgi:hypothetical protein
VLLQTEAAYVSTERINSLYRVILLGMDNDTNVSIILLLQVSVCYIHHLQGETLIPCTKPSAFYCVLCVYNAPKHVAEM